ncbi:MAG TPA: TonB-dependent receptor, partial [Candidatus Hydrogenedentes bacterium]|nr:TonB-dependent receptor [Candidatus Hydrogenedentota bacterium]
GTNWRWANIGRVETCGVEGTLEYKRGKWLAFLNYTYTDSEDEQGAMIPEISPNTANAGFQYAFTDHLNVDLRGQYLGKRKNTHEIGYSGTDWINDAFVLHGALNLTDIHGFDFQVAVKNILDEKYYHSSDTSVSRYRQPQSTVTVKVSKEF